MQLNSRIITQQRSAPASNPHPQRHVRDAEDSQSFVKLVTAGLRRGTQAYAIDENPGPMEDAFDYAILRLRQTPRRGESAARLGEDPSR